MTTGTQEHLYCFLPLINGISFSILISNYCFLQSISALLDSMEMKNRPEFKDFKKMIWSQNIYLEIVELKPDMHYYPHHCNILHYNCKIYKSIFWINYSFISQGW